VKRQDQEAASSVLIALMINFPGACPPLSKRESKREREREKERQRERKRE
jgi:hypothetical protein